MSFVFAKGISGEIKPEVCTVQKLLDENGRLIEAIVQYQNMGRVHECLRFQRLLHRNLVHLASLADASLMQGASLPMEHKNP